MRAPVLFAIGLGLLSFGGATASGRSPSYVVDGRLAALRTAPELDAPVRKRLRDGRLVVVVERRPPIGDGARWVRVAVTRRTRGWLLESALATPGEVAGEDRLRRRLAATAGLTRLTLARLALDRFPRMRAEAARTFDDEARAAAVSLSLAIAKRLGVVDLLPVAEARELVLSDPLLDRYSRLGVTFDVDPTTCRLTFRPRSGRRRESPDRRRGDRRRNGSRALGARLGGLGTRC